MLGCEAGSVKGADAYAFAGHGERVVSLCVRWLVADKDRETGRWYVG